MDGRADGQPSGEAAVIIFENEAESLPVQEVTSGAAGQDYLDTCPACHLNFHSREPKLLPCLHSFCKKCLPSPSRNLATTEPPNCQVDSATKPLNVIRCPVCRQECMEVDVMENVFVKDLLEAPSSTMERTAQLCMICDDNTDAAGFCVDCVEYLCATCVEAHQRVKFTRDHIIRQTTKESQDVRGVSAQRPMFCDNHKQEPLKLFCETCDLLTCRDCQLVEHKDHKYHFLEDAYKNHKQHMESLTHELQEKKKLIEEVSNSINTGLLQVEQNRTSVHNEIKRSICSLILEINKKGKTLVNQLEAVTKDHESVLQRQQEDIGYLSRHLDHVIRFTKWATARTGSTALLYCKRLILFQIGNLLQAKCSTSFIPQSSVRFQCRSSYWASNVDLGSLAVESVPVHQLGGFQGIPHQHPHPGGPSGSSHNFALGTPNNTLAQLQMQVDKLNPQARWQPQPPPPPWTWYQSVQLQRTVPRPLQGGSPSHGAPPQPGHRFMMPSSNHISPTSSLPSPGFTPQPLRGGSYQLKPTDVLSSSPLYTHMTPVPLSVGRESSPPLRQMIETTYLSGRNDLGAPVYNLKPNYSQSLPPSSAPTNVLGHHCPPGYAAVSEEEKPGIPPWKPLRTQQTNGEVGSAVKKRRRLSPGVIIVIKDEPDNYRSYAQANQRPSLPDSTGDQPHMSVEGEWHKVPTPPQRVDINLQGASQFLIRPQDHRETIAPHHNPLLGREQQVHQHQALLDGHKGGLCAVCQTGGELLSCRKCLRVYHLMCHVPALCNTPSGEWLCSLCCNLSESETVKKEPGSDGGFQPVDKRKCERLLLHLFCSDLSSDFQSPSVCDDNRLTIKGPSSLSTVRKRLESDQSVCYQSTAEFISDVRLIFGNRAIFSEANTEVTMAGERLRDLFEEHLRNIFTDQTFPVKVETASTDSQFDNTSQHAKRQHTYTPSCPSREEGAV